MPKVRHAESALLNRRVLRGVYMSSYRAKDCCEAVACPRCKAAKGWPCFSVNGKDTPTPHAARWRAFDAE